MSDMDKGFDALGVDPFRRLGVAYQPTLLGSSQSLRARNIVSSRDANRSKRQV